MLASPPAQLARPSTPRVRLSGAASPLDLSRPPASFHLCPRLAGANGSTEDGFGEECGDDPVGSVHDLADAQIDAHARQDIGLLATQPALSHQVVDHVADGLLR